MALISCPDCAREVSDQAAVCLQCGRPIAQNVVAAPPPQVIHVQVPTPPPKPAFELVRCRDCGRDILAGEPCIYCEGAHGGSGAAFWLPINLLTSIAVWFIMASKWKGSDAIPAAVQWSFVGTWSAFMLGVWMVVAGIRQLARQKMVGIAPLLFGILFVLFFFPTWLVAL